MIDFHSHIIPGVDDGSSSLEMSISMLENSIKEGTTSICATPHFILDEFEQTRDGYFNSLNLLRKNISGINILSGLEVYINPNLAKLYNEGKIWCINDSTYMLIELPMNDYPIYTENALYNLRLSGITPILAHPERNTKIIKNIDLLLSLANEGTIFQMNAGSLIGSYGSYVKTFAEKLVSMNLVHVLGSDAHNDTKRTTRLREAYDIIETLNPKLYKAVLNNNDAVIRGEAITCHPEIYIKKESLFKRIFKF
jgi:protein-tyrosine phosphatase